MVLLRHTRHFIVSGICVATLLSPMLIRGQSRQRLADVYNEAIKQRHKLNLDKAIQLYTEIIDAVSFTGKSNKQQGHRIQFSSSDSIEPGPIAIDVVIGRAFCNRGIAFFYKGEIKPFTIWILLFKLLLT